MRHGAEEGVEHLPVARVVRWVDLERMAPVSNPKIIASGFDEKIAA